MPIRYYLQNNPVTPDPNDQSARVEVLAKLSVEDLAAELVNRGVATSRAQATAVINGYENLVAEKIAEGYGINTPLINAKAAIQGVFTDVTDTFDPSRHALKANFSAGTLVGEKLATATVEKILRAVPAPVITAFINKNTGGINATATPGGIAQIVGEELKFDPAKTADGIYFVPATGSAVKVPTANIATRTEGELMFLTPALAAGTWHVEVRRTYGTATPVVRTGELSAVLTVA